MLTKKKIEALPPGRYPQEGVRGFSLIVRKDGSRNWILRRMVKGHTYQINLGRGSEVAAPIAWAKAAELAEMTAAKFTEAVTP